MLNERDLLLHQHMPSDGKKILISYDADGVKRKMSVSWGDESREVIYMGGLEVVDGDIQSYYHTDGRLFIDDTGDEQEEYVIADHLGNSRVLFTDADGDGKISLDPADMEVTQEAHYYPFDDGVIPPSAGRMRQHEKRGNRESGRAGMKGAWVQTQSPQDKYHFNDDRMKSRLQSRPKVVNPPLMREPDVPSSGIDQDRFAHGLYLLENM